MPILERKIEITAPVKKVWEVLTDIESYPKWQIDKKEIKKLEPNKYFEKTTQGDYTFTITELVENEKMSLKIDHLEVTGGSYILKKKGSITEVSCCMGYKTISLEKMIAQSLKIKAQALKKYVEYLENGGDPDEYNAKQILTKP